MKLETVSVSVVEPTRMTLDRQAGTLIALVRLSLSEATAVAIPATWVPWLHWLCAQGATEPGPNKCDDAFGPPPEHREAGFFDEAVFEEGMCSLDARVEDRNCGPVAIEFRHVCEIGSGDWEAVDEAWAVDGIEFEDDADTRFANDGVDDGGRHAQRPSPACDFDRLVEHPPDLVFGGAGEGAVGWGGLRSFPWFCVASDRPVLRWRRWGCSGEGASALLGSDLCGKFDCGRVRWIVRGVRTLAWHRNRRKAAADQNGAEGEGNQAGPEGSAHRAPIGPAGPSSHSSIGFRSDGLYDPAFERTSWNAGGIGQFRVEFADQVAFVCGRRVALEVERFWVRTSRKSKTRGLAHSRVRVSWK